MKKIIFILPLLILATSCYEQQRNCADFKTGKFTSEYIANGKTYTSTFERTKTRQDAGAKLLGLFADDPEGVDEMMKKVMETRRASTLRIVENDSAKNPA